MKSIETTTTINENGELILNRLIKAIPYLYFHTLVKLLRFLIQV